MVVILGFFCRDSHSAAQSFRGAVAPHAQMQPACHCPQHGGGTTGTMGLTALRNFLRSLEFLLSVFYFAASPLGGRVGRGELRSAISARR